MILGVNGGPYYDRSSSADVQESFSADYTGREESVNRLRRAARDAGLAVHTQTREGSYKNANRTYTVIEYRRCIVAGELRKVQNEIGAVVIERVRSSMVELDDRGCEA